MNTRATILLMLASACAVTGVIVADASAARGRVRALVVTGGHDFEREGFFSLFQGYDDLEYQEAAHPKANDMYAADRIAPFDVIVLYDMAQEITEQQKANLVAALRRGKGLVVLHHAIANYQEWPEYEKIIGARYYLQPKVVNGVQKARSAYEHDVKLTVHLADPKHPIVKGLKDFEIVDEVYSLFDVSPTVRPLLKTSHPKSNPVIAWTHRYGRSRVVYIQLGHGPTAYTNPSYRRLVVNAIRWAAGRETR
ncbi:MAG: ThuA domain-containing protein [Armatimonadota bacterium]